MLEFFQVGEPVHRLDEPELALPNHFFDNPAHGIEVGLKDSFCERIVEEHGTARSHPFTESLEVVFDGGVRMIAVDQDEIDFARVHLNGTGISSHERDVQPKPLALHQRSAR
jgi:hypothetical protein